MSHAAKRRPKRQTVNVTAMMEAAQIGAEWGLDLAHARINNGGYEYPPLSWEYVKKKLTERRLADGPPT